MNEFTLLTALNSIKRHLLVTVVLFLATYWVLPSLNILENQYTMQKIINVGEFEPGHSTDLLTYEEIHAIVVSANTAAFLSDSLGDSGVAQYSISRNKEGNIYLVFKSHSSDNITNTANFIMQRLKEFDEREIQIKIKELNSILDENRKVLQVIVSSDDEYIPSNADIEKFVSMQKKFDAASNISNIDRKNSSDIFGLTRLKREDTLRKVGDELKVIEIQKEMMELENIIEKGFKKVSYLFPISPLEISKYYPNTMVFFGISLLVAFFYNLIMLNVVYLKYKKSA